MKRNAPAAERNRGPILEVLRQYLSTEGRALEIASGTGQHASYFVEGLPGWTWQPSEADPAALASIEAYRADADQPRLLPPINLNVLEPPTFHGESYDLLFSANMIHISPPETTPALFRLARSVLNSGALLIIYGPFKIDGSFSGERDQAFDLSLRGRNPSWGIRDLAWVDSEGSKQGFLRTAAHSMPANNYTLVYASP